MRVARARPSMNESCHKYLNRSFSFLTAGVFTFFLLTVVFSQITFSNASADLSITKSSLSDPIIAGESLTYIINVVNSGPSDAQNVVITENYDTNFIFSSSSLFPDSGTNNQWTFRIIKAGDSETIRITGSIAPSGTGSLSNSVTLTSDMADPDPDNNSTGLSISILSRLSH